MIELVPEKIEDENTKKRLIVLEKYRVNNLDKTSKVREANEKLIWLKRNARRSKKVEDYIEADAYENCLRDLGLLL